MHLSNRLGTRGRFLALTTLTLCVVALSAETRAAEPSFAPEVKGRIQGRYTGAVSDGNLDSSAFSIARARLAAEGHLFDEALTYELQADFAKGMVELKDALFVYAFVPNRLELRLGQFKTSFSRQQLTSSGSQEFVDRAITDKYFGAGRDIGFELGSGFRRSPRFEYSLGLFNGTGDKPRFAGDVTVDPTTGVGTVESGEFTNVPTLFHPAVVGRFAYNHGDIKAYSEADLEGGDLRYAIGASGRADFDIDQGRRGTLRGELDYIVKAHGFSSTGGLYAASAQDQHGFANQALAATGFHVQAGYVLGGRYEPALRYARIEPKGPDNTLSELAAAFSVYFHGHALKWQTDAAALETGGGAPTDYRVRTQLQLKF